MFCLEARKILTASIANGIAIALTMAMTMLGISGCGGGRGGATDADGNAIGLGLTVRKVSGDNQTAKKSTVFANPIVARIEAPDGSPVPDMAVECKQISSTDAVIVGPTKFRTDSTGLISTTVQSPSIYDDVAQIQCGIVGVPNSAVFNLTSAFVVDHVEWVLGSEPALTYTADHLNPMLSFQARMIDTDGFLIDVSNTKHWLTLSVQTAGYPAPQGTTQQFFSSGIATFADITYIKSGTVTVRATHNKSGQFVEQTINVSPNSTTQTIAVLPGQIYTNGVMTLAQAVTGTPMVYTADDNFNVSVYATDDYFNTATDTSAISVTTPTDTVDTEPAGANFVAGAQTFNISPVQAKSGWLIRPVSAFTDNDSSTFSVTPGAPSEIIARLPGQTFNPGQTSLAAAITGAPTTQVAGVIFSPQIYATDSEFNVINTSISATLATSDIGDVDPAAQNLVAGTRSFSVTNVTAGTQTVTPSATGYTSHPSSNFTVQHNIATQLVVTTQPSASIVAGQEIAPVVEIRDAYGNLISSGVDATANVTLSLYTGTGTLSGTLVKAAVGGVADFAGLGAYIDLVGAKVLRLTKADTSGGGGTFAFSVNTNSLTITHAPAATLAWTTQPTNPTGAGLEIAPILEIRDAYTNVVTTGVDATANVTLSLQSGTGTLGGTVAKNAVAGVINFSGLGVNIQSTGAKTLRATKADTSGGGGTTAFFSDSSSFNVIHGPATQIVYSTQPTSPTVAGAEIAPVLEIRDTYGNVVDSGPDATATVTLTLQTGTGTLSGVTATFAVAGVANFTNLAANVDLVGTKVLRATKISTVGSGGTAALAVDSNNFNIVHAPANSLVWTTQPASGVAGTNLTPIVEIRDVYGNVVTSDNTSIITLSIQTNPGTSTLAGDFDLTVSSGVATWTATQVMYLNKVGTGYVLQASDGTRTANSASFNVNHAAANSLAWTTQPASGAAGTNLTPVVEIQDTYGNIVTSDSTSIITLSIQTNPGTSTLAGDVDLTVSSGVATWTATEAMYLNKVGTGYALQASDGTRTANSASFNVTHAAANSLAWTTQPATGVAGTNLTPVVEIRDVYGNVVTSDNTSIITLNIQTNPGTSTLAGDFDLTVSSGVATWTATEAMYLNKVGTGYVLQASDGTRTANSASFNVTHAAANSLSWTTQPANSAAGTDLTPVVKILDAYGNVITSDSTSVITLSIQTNPGSSTLAGDVDLTVSSGVATWTATEAMYLNKVGTGYVLQASDGTRTANSSSFNVTHATANSLSWTTQPATGAAGTNLTPVVEIQDTYGNIVTSDNTSVITLSIQTNPGTSTLAGDVDLSVSSGVATWTAAQAMYLNKVGTGYVLQASDGTRTTNSASFNVTHAAANSLAWTTQPASGVAGTNLTPVVEIRDVYGNVVTSDNTSIITLSIQTNPGTSTLAGDFDLTVSSGVATWTATEAMYLNKVGTGYVLQASDGTRTANSASFNVTHAAANSLSWTTQPASGAAGTNLTPVVEIQDTYGNIVTSDNTSVITLSIQTNPGTSTLAGDADLTVSSGVATWTATQAMYLNKVATGYVLQASDGTRTTNSASFNVTHAAANSLAWTTQPASGVAGTNLTPVVEIRDVYGNVVTSDSTSVITLSIQTNPGTSTLAGDFDLTVSSGVATWTAAQAMYLNKVGTGYVLQASDGTRTANSASFNVTHAAANSLLWTTQPASGAAGTNLTPVVEIQDTYGNIVTSDSTSVITLSIQTDPGSSTLAGDFDLTVSSGVATWTATEAMYLNKAGTGYVLQASDGTRTANSASFNVTHAAANSLSWTTQPATGAAGTNLTPVVEIQDTYGNIVTSDSTSVITLSIQTNPGTSTLAGDVDLSVSSGVATWTATEAMYLNKVGTGYVLQASDGTRTANSASFNVTHAAANSLSWTTQPASGVAGTNLTPVVEIRDFYGNVVTSDNTSIITLSIQTNPGTSTLAGDFDLTVSSGVATWTATEAMYLNKSGTGYVLQASDGTRTANSVSFNVTHAAANSLAWTTQPADTSAGANLTPVVKILDLFGNVITSDSTSIVTLSINSGPGGATLSGDVDLTVASGVATWTAAQAMKLDLLGAYTLHATDGTRSTNSNSFNVGSASPAQLVFSTQPASSAAGANLLPVVEIQDAYGNIVVTDNASVITLSIQTNPGSSTLAGDIDLTVVNGVATWTATEAMFLNKVGTGYVLRASGLTFTVDSSAFNITPAAANSLSWTTQPANSTAGAYLTPVVEILDAYGNVVTTDNTSLITLSIQTNPGGGTLAGDVDLTVSSGVATWTATEAMYLDKSGTGYVLQASDGTRTANSSPFNITHAAANSLSWTTQPANSTAGANLTPVVKILDTYGNVVNSDNTSVITLSIQTNPGSSTLAGDVDLTVSSGVATWTATEAMYLDKSGTGYVLQASDGTRTANSASFNVTHAAANSLSWTTQPANSTAGANLTPVVKILDTYGNVVSSDNTSVITLSIQTNPGSSTLAGDVDLTVSSGVATWTATEAMYLDKSGTGYVLQASDGTRTSNSSTFNITHAAANSLSWTTQPANSAAGANLTPVVKILDTYGNVVSSDNTSVITLSIQTNPGSSTIAGDVDLTVSSGVATWTATEAMYLDKSGTGYVLQASDGTRTANSSTFNITHAAANSLSWTTQPANSAAGANLTPVVKILDTYGNVITSDSTSVITLSIQTNPGSSTLAGDFDVTVSSGVATWTATEAMYLDKSGTGYVLQASDGTRTANSATFNITHAAANSLSWTTQPANSAAGANLTPVVKILDTYGNVVTSDNTSVITLSIQTNPGSSTIAGDVDLTVSSGVATWTATEAMYLDKSGTGYVLQASDGTRTSNSSTFNITHAAANSLAWTTQPATGVAGTNLTPVVKILDTYGNVVSSDNTSVITLSIQTNPGTSTLAGDFDVTVSSGVATWTATEAMYLNKVGTGYALQASDGTRTANSASFNVTHAAANSLAWTTQPATGVAGTNLTPVVEIRDIYGNVVTSDSTSIITLSIQTNPGSSTLAGDFDVTVSSGVATWTATEAMYLNKVGTGYALQASDGTRTANSASFNVTHAAANSLAWTTQPANSTAGTNLTPVVKILDTYGNVVSSDNTSVITLSIQTNPGSSTLAGDVDLTVSSGVATWTATEAMYLDKVGTGYVLQASDGTRTSNSSTFNITHAAANSLSWTTQPANSAAGANLTPVVKILDTYGNVITSDSTSVITMSIQTNPGSSTLAGDFDVTVSSGVATWTATEAMYLDKSGTGYVLQASDGTRTANSSTFNITHAAANSLSWTTQPASGAAGSNLTPVVKILDTYGNVVSSDNTSVITLSLQTNPGSGTLAGDVDLTVSGGVATWTATEAMYLDKSGTGYVLQASDGTRTANSTTFNVTHASAAALVFATQPSNTAAGSNILPVVEIHDAYGNVVTSDNTTLITLSIQTNPASGALSGDIDLTVSSGVATWTAIEAMYIDKMGSGYVLQASDGTRTANSSSFNITPAAAASLAWTTQPSNSTAGAYLVPVIEVRDTFGNVVTTDNTSVITLSIQTNPGSSTLAGDVDLTVASGVATWTATEAIYLDKSATGYVLQASDGTRTANSTTFNITHAAANSLSWTTQPANSAAGANLTPVVKILDSYGNVVSSDNTSVITLSIQTNPGSSTLAGDVDLTVASGVATWTATEAMYLDKSGTGYVLQASDGTRTANSSTFNITHAAANSLSWTTQPANSAAGANLTPVVKILDTYGNVVSSDNTSVITLSIQTNPGTSTLAGDFDLTVSSGVATWTATEAIYLNKVGTGYVLQASDGTRTANSATFNITHAAANSLSWTTQPASSTAGANLTPVVKIMDAFGNVITSDNTSVITLSIQTNPGTSTLAGDFDLTVSSGVATWTATEAIYLNKVGTGYVLQASDGTRTANSATFNITHAAANSLSWTTQPANSAAGTNLTPVVKILDTYGNVVSSDNTSVITLSIQTNPGSSTLAGDVDLTVSSGVATWTATEATYLDKVGTGYVLQASDGTRTANSATFNITHAAANSLSWTTQPANSTAGVNLTPVVKILDTYGNVITSDSTSVITLSIQTNPGSSTLAGDFDLTVSSGVATWTATEAMYLDKSGTGYVLQASDGTRTANSSTFNITHAAANSLSWTTQPANSAAGANLTPVVKILDTYGNVITSDSTSVITLSIQTNPSSSTLAGDVDLTVSSGVATWTATEAMYLDKSGTGYVLQASDGTRTANSSTFNITHAAAAALVFATQPANSPAGSNLLPSVEIRDSFGNVTTSDSTSVITLSIQTNPAAGTLSGDIDLTVTNGVATWTATEAMYLDKLGTGYVLQASDGTRTVNSSAFNITAAAVASLAWTTQPASSTAGGNLLPVIEVRDTFGNVVSSDNTSVITISIQTNPGGGTLSGDVDLTVSSGVATWTATEAMYLDKSGTGYVLQASDGTRTANSSTFNITHAAANSLSWTTQPANSAAGANLTPVVKILDTYGNVVTSDSTSMITLSIQTNPGSSTLAGDVDLTVSSGVATWTATEAMYLDKSGTGYVLQASDGTRTANSASFNITHAAANSLSWTTQPANSAAGANLTPVVKILDTYGNIITSDSTSVITLSIQTNPGSSTLAGDVDLTVSSGVATWTATEAMYLDKSGTGYVLQASDGTRTANSATFNVTHAAANSLSWTTQPANSAAGTNLTPVVKILDTYGNVITSDSTSVITLSIQTNPGSSTLAGDVDLTVSSGVATWTATEAMYLDKVGTGYVLQASDGTRTANTSTFNITHAAANSLSWTTQPANSTAGANLTPVVKILDAYGNVVSSDNTSVITLSIQTNPGSSTLAGDVDLTVSSGVAAWTATEAMYLDKVGTGYVLQASDGTRTSNSSTFNITHAAASSLSWTTQPANSAAGANLTPVVKILDAYGNVITSDSTSVITLSIQTNPGSSTLAGDVDLTVSGGVATWTATEAMYLDKTGTGYVLQASDGTRTANSASFNITHAAVSSLAFATQPANSAAGSNLFPVIEVRDAYGNVVTSDSTSVITLSIQTNPGSSTLAGDVDLTVSSGVATWTATEAMYLDKTGTGYVLQASDGTRTANSSTFNITHAAANSLSWTTQPANSTAGANLTPVVKILDTYGNVVSSDNTSVITLSIQTNPGSSTLAGDVDLTVSGGVATWTATEAMYLDKSGTGYVLQASDGTRTANSSTFNITHAAANSLSWTTQPANSAAGANLTPVVKILDAYGNVITSDSTSVITLSIQTNPGSSTLAGDVDLTVSGGVATWTATEAMYLDKTGTGYVLQASDGTRTANSSTFNITHAAVSSLAFTTQPANSAAGSNLFPVIEVRDAYGNVVTSDSTSVITLSIQTNPGSSTLAGDVDLTVSSGVATWTATEAMYLDKVGTGYVLQASDGTRTANSSTFNITHASANSLSWTTQPANSTAGANLVPVVKIVDAYGNVITSDSTSVITLSIQTNPGSSTLAGDVDLAVASGVATWTATEAMYLDKVGTGYVLQASDGTRTANSSTFNITHAAANSLSWTTQPANSAAGTNLVPVVKIVDAYGNVITSDSTSVITLSIQTNPGSSTLAGDVDLTVSSGVATWTATEAMYLDKVGTGYALQASDGTRTANSSTFNITHAAVSSLAFATQPASSTAGSNLFPVIEVRDAYGNVVTSDSTSVITLSIQTNPGSSTLAGDIDLTVSSGVATWTATEAMYLNKTGTGYVLQASDGTRTANSASFNVTAGAANALSWTTQPTSGVAGTNLVPVVKIVDAYGNVITSDSTSVITLSIQTNPGSSTLAGDIDLTVASGVATWTATEAMYLNKTGTGYVLQASDGTRTANSASFNVTAGAANALSWTTQPTSGVAGTNLVPVVKIVDAYGNVITSDSTSVITLSIQTNPGSSTLAGDIDLTVASGVATWTATEAMYLNKTGTGYVLQASDGTRTANSASFNVTPAAASSLAWTTQPSSGTAGTSLTPVVKIFDSYGNVVDTDNTSTITLTIQTNPSSGTLNGDFDLTVTSGVATWTGVQAMYIDKTGTGYVLRASDGTRTADSSSFNVTHGAASQIVYTTAPVTGTASSATFGVVGEIRDAYGNLVTSGVDSSANVTLTIPTKPGNLTNSACSVAGVVAALSGTTTVGATNGVATFSGLSLNVGGSYVMRASDGTRSVDSSSFSIVPGAVTALYWKDASGTTTNPNSTRTAGQNFTTGGVVACDAVGNTAANTTDTVTFEIDDNNNPTGDTLHGTVQASFSSGVGSLSSVAASIYLASGTAYKLIATDDQTGATTATASGSVTVSAANYTTMTFTSIQLTWPDASTVIPVTAQPSDAYGNLRTTGCAGSATLSLSTNPGGTLGGTLTSTRSGCVYTWSNVNIDVATSLSGFVASATTSSSLCNGNTTTCTGTSTSFEVTTDPGLNLEHAVELLDVPLACRSGGTSSSNMSRTGWFPNYYSGTVTYTYVIVATNTDGGSRTIALRDSAGSTVASISVPTGVTTPTRYSTTFTPASGITNYRVRQNTACTTQGALKVYSARIVITQNNNDAYGTILYVPLLNKLDSASTVANASGTTSGGEVDGTTSTSDTQNDPDVYAAWEFDSSLFATIPSGGIAFEANIAGSSGTYTTYASLYDKTADSIVPGTTVSVASTTITNKISTWLDPSALTDGHDYEVRISTSNSAGTAKIYRAGLWIKVLSLSKFATYWRTSPHSTSTAATYIPENNRVRINTANYSSPTVSYECTGSESSDGLTADLVYFGDVNSGTSSPTQVSGSSLDFSSSSYDLLRNVGLTLPSGYNQYLTRINGSSGAIKVSGCRIVISH